jgi:hypothetical protein
MNAGIKGLESFLFALGRLCGWSEAESISSLRDSIELLAGITV